MNSVAQLTTTTPSMSQQRLWNAYLTEAKFAFLRFLRTPAFAIPTLLFPVLFYFLIGFIFGAFRAAATNSAAGTYMFCGFATMAALTPGMFGFGIGLAMERENGLLILKRALPMPPMASLLGSVAMSMLSTMLAVLLLSIGAFALGTITLTVQQLIAVLFTVTTGAIPFCAVGLLLGTLVSGRAAPAIVNIVYIVLVYFSGLFIPLPKAIESIVVISPSFYLHQLSLAVAGGKYHMVGGVTVHIAILIAVTIVSLGLATRRLQRAG